MWEKVNSLGNFGKEDFKRVIDSLSDCSDLNYDSTTEKIVEGFKHTWLKIIDNINNNPDGIEGYNTYEFEFNRGVITYLLQTDDSISSDRMLECYVEINNLSAQLTDAIIHAKSKYQKEKFKENSKIRCKICDMITEISDMIKELIKKMKLPGY